MLVHPGPAFHTYILMILFHIGGHGPSPRHLESNNLIVTLSEYIVSTVAILAQGNHRFETCAQPPFSFWFKPSIHLFNWQGVHP